MQVIREIFWIVVFPGFVFTLAVGLLVSWLIRKVTAMVQWRVGPPVLQPLYDIVKLAGKEILIPQQANRAVFVLAPIMGMAGVLVLAVVLWNSIIRGQVYIGDVIVAIYLMVIPSLALILGSSASGSPHAALGASREMKLVISYELPLVLAFIVVIIKSNGQLSLVELARQMPIASISGFLGFVVSLLCIQAKLGFVPFDIAESETEIASGVLIEYSGVLLGIWKIMQAMMVVVLPLFLVVLFLGGFGTTGWSLVGGVVKYLLIVVLITLIKNTNPRVRIDQAMKFFWAFCGSVLAVAVVLAVVGNIYGIGWL